MVAANDTTPSTPGPWEYCYDGSSTWSVGQAADPQEMPPYVCIMDRNDRRAQANARLIAAAPDMYEALKFVRRLWAKDDSCEEILAIDAALAKVEGRE